MVVLEPLDHATFDDRSRLAGCLLYIVDVEAPRSHAMLDNDGVGAVDIFPEHLGQAAEGSITGAVLHEVEVDKVEITGRLGIGKDSVDRATNACSGSSISSRRWRMRSTRSSTAQRIVDRSRLSLESKW